jgi:hypothetical protein
MIRALFALPLGVIALVGCQSKSAAKPASTVTVTETAPATASSSPTGGAATSASSRPTAPSSSAAAPSAASPSGSTNASGATVSFTGPNGLTATATATIVAHADLTGAQAAQNGEYEAADVKIAVTAGLYEFSTYAFSFEGANGISYPPSEGNALLSGLGDPQFGSGSLKAGMSATGYLVFDVPRGGGTLQLQGPQIGQGIVAQWTVSN